MKLPLPGNLQRLSAYEAKIATSTERTVADTATISELTKYCASGTVCQMSMKDWIVGEDGIQVNSPCTSGSVFSDEASMTYSGASTNTDSSVSVTYRKSR